MGKTGTTALQEFFWENRRILAESGISYPKLGVKSGAHHLLSPHIPVFLADEWQFISVEDWAPKLATDGSSPILLSSELIAWTMEETALAFCACLKEWFEPKIVIYLRRQDNLLMAGYNQQIKAGTQKRDIQAVLRNQLNRYDYAARLSPWTRVLGKENIIVRPYERQQFYRSDIRKDFLHHVFGIEVNTNYTIKSKNSNPRLSFPAMEYKRLINNLIVDTSQSTQFNKPLLKYSTINDGSSDRIYSTQALLSPKERREILEKCTAANEMIAREYMGRTDGRLFYEASPDNDKEWEQRIISDKELEDISVFLAKRHPNLIKIIEDSIQRSVSCTETETRSIAVRLAQSLDAAKQQSRKPRFWEFFR
jgi:hypothetical protein